MLRQIFIALLIENVRNFSFDFIPFFVCLYPPVFRSHRFPDQPHKQCPNIDFILVGFSVPGKKGTGAG